MILGAIALVGLVLAAIIVRRDMSRFSGRLDHMHQSLGHIQMLTSQVNELT